MANIKISELDELVNVADNDYLPIVDTSAGETKKVKAQFVGAGGKTGDTLPIGAIISYSGETAPTNWLICNGNAISRTDYADLFNVIGTKYGEGDGSTTFNLPDLRGKIAVGLNDNDTDFNAIGKTGGEKTHTLTINEMPSHNHDLLATFSGTGAGINNVYGTIFSATANASANRITEAKNSGETRWGVYEKGGSQSHNNLQPYQVTNYIIKAFQSAGVVANVTSTKSNSISDVYNCKYVNEAIDNAINEKIETKYILVTAMASQTVGTASVVTLDTEVSKNGGFVLNSNVVWIPNGVSKIEVSGSILVDGFLAGSNYVWGQIRKNNTPISGTIVGGGSSYISASIPSTIIDVTLNDKISLICDCPSGGVTRTGSSNTWLYIKAIE